MDNYIKEVKINNNAISYFKFGSGKKTMVIIPGLNITSVMTSYKEIIDAYNLFSKDYTVYCFDRKKEIDNNYSINDMADDYILAFDNLKLDNIYLFGTSQGGMISLLISLKKPEIIKKMALGSTTYYLDDKKFDEVNNWINLAINKDKLNLCLSFSKKMYPKEFYDKFYNILVEYSKTITDKDIERFIICAKALKGFDIRDNIKNIKCDTLFIEDKKDELLGDISEDVNKLNMPNFKTYSFDGYGHVAYDLAPTYKELLYKYYNE